MDKIKKLQEALKKLQSELVPLVKANSQAIKTKGVGDENRVKTMGKLAKDMEALRAQIADLQAGNTPAAEGEKTRQVGSPGRQFATSEAYKAWKTTRSASAQKSIAPVKVGRLFGQKAVSTDIDQTNAGALIIPFYRPGLIENAKAQPFIRELVTVLPTSNTNLIKTDREVVRREITAKATAIEAIGTQVFAVSNTIGFDDVVPFNSFTLDNGVATETLLIDSIDHDALTITTTAVSTIAMAVDDAYYGIAYTTTPEGALVPNSFSVWEDYDVPIVDLFTFVKATLDKLSDVAGLEDVINRRLLASIARMETVNCLYAQGSTGQMTGIFQDSDVAEITWSEQTSGDNVFDFFLDGYYTLAGDNYRADALVVDPATHKQFVDMKASDGHYLFLPSLSENAPTQVMAIRFMWSNLLLPTHGVLADWKTAMTLYDRENSEISMGTEDDDFTRRKRTILGGERIGFGIELPAAVLRMIFDAPPAAE